MSLAAADQISGAVCRGSLARAEFTEFTWAYLVMRGHHAALANSRRVRELLF